MDTLENLNRKIEGAGELKSIVRTMKAMAASNIGQYEMAVNSLEEYYYTVVLGITAYFKEKRKDTEQFNEVESKKKEPNPICVIVFGSDQGLVGQFNDTLTDYVSKSLKALPGEKEVWAVGERVQAYLSDAGFETTKLFSVPNSVDAITVLVGELLIQSEESREKENKQEIYIFHNQSKSRTLYTPVMQRLLPLDKKWRDQFSETKWPTKKIPQVLGEPLTTLSALIREYLFVSLFKACAESLACENASRLSAMHRAEKNITELLDVLKHKYHSLRQSSIDEELFDVVSGFEALKNKNS